MATTTIAINLDAKTKGTDSVKSLKAQIREATQEAAAMSQKFGEFSPQALEAAKRVADLKDQMDDLNEKIQALHPDKFNRINTIAKGVANGFQAAQGAMALFGSESEEVQKTLLKVQGAMAFAQGLEGLDAAGKQLKTIGQAGVAAFKSMTTASKVFMATGLGLLLAALGTVAAYWDEIAKSLGFAKSEMDKMNAAMKVAEGLTRQQAADLQYYNKIVQDTKKSETERKGALDKLKQAGIATDDVNIANANSLEQLNIRTQKQILLIAQRARTEAASQILQEKTKRLLELQTADLDEQTSTWDNFYAGAVGALMGINKGAQELAKRGFSNLKEAQKDVNDATKVYNNERNKQLVLDSQSLATAEQVKSTLDKQKEAQKELNKEHEKRTTKSLTREQQLFLNIRAGLKAGEDFDKELKAKQQKREQVAREFKVENAMQWLEESKKNAAAEIELEQRKQDAIQAARLSGLQGASDVFNALSGLMKEGSDAAKAFALAGIAADTAKAISATIAEARNSAATMTAMGIPPPGPQIAAAGIYASGLAMVLNNAKRARDILRGGSASGGGGGSIGAVGAAPGAMTPLTGGALPEEGQFGGMGRVYVLEGDITKTQTRVRRLRNTSVV